MEVPKLSITSLRKRETSRLAWTTVASEVQLTKLKVTKLLKGNEYIFRVMHVNKYGVGEPSTQSLVGCSGSHDLLIHLKPRSYQHH